jgi:poly(3-hydroxybutyrate) depolymerase
MVVAAAAAVVGVGWWAMSWAMTAVVGGEKRKKNDWRPRSLTQVYFSPPASPLSAAVVICAVYYS